MGTTTGSLDITDSGTANYSVAIAVPPGVNGVQPQLAINYSSGAGNGVAGIGGHLVGLSAITRCGQTIVRDAQANHGGDISRGRASGVDLSDNDQLCLGGQGLVLVGGTHATTSADYRTEIESFQRIKITSVSKGPQTFTVETPNGGTMTFGGTAGSRVSHSDGRVIQWLVSSFSDAFGNTINYTYTDYGTGGAQEILPDEVSYGGNTDASTSDNIKVELDYETRPDTRQAFRFGQKFSTTQRLTNIRTSVGSDSAKDYQIDYAQTPVSLLSRMTQITECSGAGTCLPPVVFDWNEVSQTYTSGGSVPDAMVDAAGRTRGVLADINGDGRQDWMTSYELNGVHTAQTWLGNESGGWDSSTSWRAPSPLRRHSGTNDEVALAQIVDIDGDGLLDWVEAYQEGDVDTLNAWRNDGTTLVADASFVLSGPLFNVSNPAVPRTIGKLVDLNADGRPDFVYGVTGDCFCARGSPSGRPDPVDGVTDIEGVTTRGSYLRTDTGWEESLNYLPDVLVSYMYSAAGVEHGQFVDINGDGLIDWVYAFGWDTNDQHVWLNTGDGWNKTNAWSGNLPVMLWDRTNDAIGHYIAYFNDINGDGLPDLVRASTGTVSGTTTWINQGDGRWVVDGGYALPTILVNLQAGGHTQRQAVLKDVNHDGLPDLVRAYETTGGTENLATWRNTGSGWVQDNRLNLPTALFQHRSGKGSYSIASHRDVNQDGYADVFKAQQGSTYTVWEGGNSLGEEVPEVLTQVTDGFGVEHIITYQARTEMPSYWGVTAGTYPIANANAAIFIPSLSEVSDGSGGYLSRSYHRGPRKAHKLRGGVAFEYRSIYESQTAIQLWSQVHLGDLDFGLVWLDRTFFHNRGVQSQINYEKYTYEERGLNGQGFYGGKTRLPSVATKLVMQRDDIGTGTLLQNTTISYVYTDGTQAPTSVEETSVISNTLDSGPEKAIYNTLTTSFKNENGSTWLVGLPERATTDAKLGSSGLTVTNTVSRRYSGEGRVLTETFEATTDNELAQQFVYDTFGNLTRYSVTGKLDPAASGTETRTTTTTYTSDGRFPVDVTNAEGHTASATYNDLNGQQWTTIDPNGIERETYYDDLGRVFKTTVTAADAVAPLDPSNHAKVVHLLDSCVSQRCPPGASHSIFSVPTADTPPSSLRYLDELQRPVRIQTVGENGESIYVDFEYSYVVPWNSADGRYHRTVKQSLPYFSNSTDPILWTETTYDALGRVNQTINADGTITDYDYYERTTLETSGSNLSGYMVQDTITVVDMNGNPIQVTDANLGSIQYAYDAHGNLIQTTDAGGAITTMVYDNLDRQTQLDEPNLGTTDYLYNAFDNLIKLTDAKGQIFEYSYDKLDRPVSRTDDSTSVSGPSVITHWEYDLAANGVGQLNRVTNNEGYERVHAYDGMSRGELETITIGTGGGGSDTSVTETGYYGISNRVDWVKYDSDLVIRKTRDAYGLPKEIRSDGLTGYQDYIDKRNAVQVELNIAQAIFDDPEYQSLNAQYTAYIAQAASYESASVPFFDQANVHLDHYDYNMLQSAIKAQEASDLWAAGIRVVMLNSAIITGVNGSV